MQFDETDDLPTSTVPNHPRRWCALGLVGYVEGHRGDSVSDDVAKEILSKTHGTKESGDDFRTASTRAVGHAVRTAAAEFKDPTESARAIIAGVLRGAGENEEMALKTLEGAACAVLREALLLGYGPTAWIDG